MRKAVVAMVRSECRHLMANGVEPPTAVAEKLRKEPRRETQVGPLAYAESKFLDQSFGRAAMLFRAGVTD
jgi:hypothetical protein